MGQFEKAQQVYEVMLNQTTDDREKTFICNELGGIEDNKGEYKKGILFYERSLEIYQKNLPPNHFDLANVTNFEGRE
ncbi:unnamed protein product, partial [Rotaria sp. Silwood1]